MHLFYAPDIETTGLLPDEEATHCLRVLRLRESDAIDLTDGKGNFFRGIIAEAGKRSVRVDLESRTPWEKTWGIDIHLAVAPTKNADRMEWLCEKACEIGLDKLTFLECRYSERRSLKTDRLRKILISAMKQSLKGSLPVLEEMMPFEQFVRLERPGRKFIAHCHEGEKHSLAEAILPQGTACTLLIGPEGDFSEEEVKTATACGYEPISIGRSRLRTETAALAAVALLNLQHQKQ